jgi:biotin carboxylase
VTSASVRVLLVAPTASLTERARGLWIDPFVVTTKDRAGQEHIGPAARAVVVDSLTDEHVLPLVAASHEIAPLAGVVSLTEHGLEPAARIAAALGVRGATPRSVRLSRDKLAMRRALANAGLPPVAARPVRCRDDVLTFGAHHGYPLMLKPSDGVGSAGVVRIEHPGQVRRLAAALPGLMAEEHLPGAEISVEGFSVDGSHRLLAITEKQVFGGSGPAGHVECSHALPARLPEATERAVRTLTAAALTAIGVVGGPTHTELKLTPAGPLILETHTRAGGDHLPDLLRLTTGVDLAEQTLRWAAGLPVDLRTTPQSDAGAAVRFLAPPPGTLRAVWGARRLDGLSGIARYEVTARPGDTIPPVRRSRDRVGYVLAVGADAAEALQRADRAAAAIAFDVVSEAR